jgi:O-antigen/teichoic acid export membrane protein
VAAYALPGVFSLWLFAYLIDRVGATEFGLWVTTQALLAPLAVLDAGLALAVLTAAASYGRPGGEESADRIRAATSLYAVLSVLALLLGGLIGFVPQSLLDLTPAAAETARLVVWILAVDFALVLGTSAWTGVLRGLRRYDLTFACSVVQVVIALTGTLLLVGPLGLVGAALAQVGGRLGSRILMLALVRYAAPWYRARPGRPSLPYLRQVVRYAAPLIVMHVAGQLSFAADVIIVGAINGPTAATAIAVGARLPALAVAVLQLALDVLLPRLVEEREHGGAGSPLLANGLKLAGFVGATVFLGMIVSRDQLLTIWVGPGAQITATVFALYSLAWLIHMPAHVLGLTLLSRARHDLMAPLVLVEGLLNLTGSLILVSLIGPTGAALASLLAVGFSNGIALPALFVRITGTSARSVGRPILQGVAAGVAVAFLAALPVFLLPQHALLGLACQGTVSIGLSALAIRLLWSSGPGDDRRPAANPDDNPDDNPGGVAV